GCPALQEAGRSCGSRLRHAVARYLAAGSGASDGEMVSASLYRCVVGFRRTAATVCESTGLHRPPMLERLLHLRLDALCRHEVACRTTAAVSVHRPVCGGERSRRARKG